MIEIKPVNGPLNFEITVPGSKSISNRALLIAALAEGESSISNCLESDDTKYMMQALQDLGIKIWKKENIFFIQGKGGKLDGCKKDIFLGNAGTAVRFLTAACSLGTLPYTITGNEHMQKRPIYPLLEALEQAGLTTESSAGCPPHKILSGTFKGGNIQIEGSLSSQYISALLMIAPYAQQDTTIEIIGELSSKPYVDITLKVIQDFGVEVDNYSYKSFKVKAGQKYQARDFKVESDFSSASYFVAIAALTGGKATLNNLSLDSAQGDKDFLTVAEQMGCQIETTENKIIIQGPKELKALGELDLNHIPDTALTAAILAAFTTGETKITNIANLRIKECDRLAALEKELGKIGIDVRTDQSSITIIGKEHKDLNAANIETYDDHRIAMCFACLGTVVNGIKIQNPNCVQKSYPNFWDDLEKIGIELIRN